MHQKLKRSRLKLLLFQTKIALRPALRPEIANVIVCKTTNVGP